MCKTILVAEDEPKNIKLVRDFLELHGYIVLHARDGLQVIALAKAHQPDLILMDIQMPRMSGLEAISQLKQCPETCQIPVIALTAYAMRGDKDKAFEAGFDGYITKPIHVRNLLQEVTQYLS